MVYCRGSKDNGKAVIKALEAHGGVNTVLCEGKFDNSFYYINPNGEITLCDYQSDEASLVKEFYTEIQPLAYRAEKGESYWHVIFDGFGETHPTAMSECDSLYDRKLYNAGNYYTSREACQKVANQINNAIKEIIRNSKKE